MTSSFKSSYTMFLLVDNFESILKKQEKLPLQNLGQPTLPPYVWSNPMSSSIVLFWLQVAFTNFVVPNIIDLCDVKSIFKED